MNISIGDYVKTTNNEIFVVSGKVIEDYGNKVVIIDDYAETDDNELEFHKSDLEIINLEN